MSRPLLRAHGAERIEAVAGAARAWRDPEHAARAGAVEQTLEAPNRFTEEALAFAVNAAAHRLTEEALRVWLGKRPAPASRRAVAVTPGEGGAPLAGLRAVLAVVLAGHCCVFRPPTASPALVPAFLAAVTEAMPQHAADDFFSTAETTSAALDSAEAAIGGGDEAAQAAFERGCEEADVPPARRLWRGVAFSVAVLDGREDENARDGLAEDALLYEGRGRSSMRLLWAPAGIAPDPYLSAMARFRAVFPAHPDTPGALQMQKAFLEAQGRSHAHGDGLEFLMSRGAPEAQAPGHLRWVEYESLGEIRDWLDARAASVHALVARPALRERLPGSVLPGSVGPPMLPFGAAHRQWPGAPGSGDMLDFVSRL